ncbi:MAG: GDP-mannose 4,6-dehydratase [Acidobacteriaceae bacterium]|nr:GDP-mannose 4,6-dehydratase [Acidobacteriaceae bacterium]
MSNDKGVVLITGGAGFIGSHLSERLLREDRKIVVIDDLNDYYSPQLKTENLNCIRSFGDFDFYHCDICDEAEVARIVRKHEPHTIVHLAARAGVRPSLENPILYERVNVHGTLSLLEAARKNSVRKFVFASSSSIYGAANRVPFVEDDHVNLPISPYAATKIAGEKICFTYSHLYGMQAICLRFFTVYGPRQRPDLAIRKFIEMVENGDPIPVYGDGSSGRDYTYITDILDGIEAAIAYDCRFETFNLGNSHPVSLATMIRTIEKTLCKEAETRLYPEQPGDVPLTYADISKARKLLGYSPRVSFSEGIRQFVEWFQQRSQVVQASAAI